MEDPMTEARALTPPIYPFLSFTLLLLSFPHHHHHPCLAASGISFLGGIGIALCFFVSSQHRLLLPIVTLPLVYLLHPHFIQCAPMHVRKSTWILKLNQIPPSISPSSLNTNPTLEVFFSLRPYVTFCILCSSATCLSEIQPYSDPWAKHMSPFPNCKRQAWRCLILQLKATPYTNEPYSSHPEAAPDGHASHHSRIQYHTFS